MFSDLIADSIKANIYQNIATILLMEMENKYRKAVTSQNNLILLDGHWRFKIKMRHCLIWQNSNSKLIAQAYPVTQQQANILNTLHSFKNNYIVKIIGFISDEQKKMYMLTQRIPGRLSEHTNLTQNQCIKVMISTCQALSFLQNLYGNIGLSEQCIGFNEEGKVKVWIHPCFSSIKPIKSYKQQKNNDTLRKNMIWQLINMVQQKCLNRCLFSKIKERLCKKNVSTYKQVSKVILKIAEDLFLNFETLSCNLNSRVSQQLEKKAYMQPKSERYYEPMKQQLQHSTICEARGRSQIRDKSKSQIKETTQGKKIYKNPSIATFHNILEQKHHNDRKAHKRYYSNLDPQASQGMNRNSDNQDSRMKKNIYIGGLLTKQEGYGAKGDYTRSAPLSPQKNDRQDKYCFNKTKKNVYSKAIERIEEQKEGEDSFCFNLKPEHKQILYSTEFQTFGLLEVDDALEPNLKTRKEQKGWHKNCGASDLQPQRSISPPSDQKKPLADCFPEKPFQNYHEPINRMKSENNSVLGPKQKQNSLMYKDIDKKYEQYVCRQAKDWRYTSGVSNLEHGATFRKQISAKKDKNNPARLGFCSAWSPEFPKRIKTVRH